MNQAEREDASELSRLEFGCEVSFGTFFVIGAEQ